LELKYESKGKTKVSDGYLKSTKARKVEFGAAIAGDRAVVKQYYLRRET